MDDSILSFFVFGFAYGLLHAFDPDHLAAVTGMSAARSQNKIWRTAFHWSLGHGGVITLLALLVFFAGVSIPDRLSHAAEELVAFMLMGIGLLGLWRLRQDQLTSHCVNSGRSSASFVGMLHGTAGSAPLLTLIPLSKVGEPTVGLVYVLLFCLGVSIAMLGLGGLIQQGALTFKRFSAIWHQAFHLLLSLFAFFFGFYLFLF